MASDISFLELLNQIGHAHTLQIDAAYNRGREAGRREAMTEFKARLAGLTDLISGATEEDEGESTAEPVETSGSNDEEETEGRAPAGSVKPAILKLISERPGLTTGDINRLSGLKPNSIRGTLWALKKDAEVEWRAGQWFPVARTNEAAGEVSEPDAPTASITDTGNGVSDQHSPGLEEPERLVVDDNMS